MTAAAQPETALPKEYPDRILKLLKDPVTALAKDIVEEQFARLREQATARGAPLVAGAAAPPAPPTSEEKGRDVARLLRCLAGSKGDVEKGLRIAKELFGEQSRVTQALAKQLAATSATAGGFLVGEEMSADVIELLRPASAVRQLNPVTVPMDNGTLNLPKITGGAAAAYIGENTNAPKTTLTFGNVKPTAKKIAALVPISNDLIRRRGPGTDTMVRDDLVAAIQQKSDGVFIRSNGSVGEPKGMLFWAPAGNKFNANGTVNAQNVAKDLGTAIQKLADNNTRFIRPGWIFSHRTYVFLLTLMTTTNQFIFREEITRGTLMGYPFARTTQVPNNLGGGTNESEVYLADFADNVIAAFSQDQTVIRAILEHDLVMRHDESVAVIQAVIWV